MYVERAIKERFLKASRLNNVVFIVGPRQSGKTTFLREQGQGLASYVLFDDPDARELFDKDVKAFENQYLQNGKPTILDEIQYAKEAGSKLKYLADTGRKLWITSSSQTMLGKEVIGWLVGRASILTLYQFSFEEFLAAKNQRETTETIILRLVDEHMRYGGYPKIVLEAEKDNKEMLLKDLYQTMVFRDVARMFNIEDLGAVERLAVYLSHRVGDMLVYNKICSDLSLSFQSVKKYIDAMEKSYIIKRVSPFYKNKLNEIIKQPKLYFIDTGLRNAIANDFALRIESRGKLFENYVFSELIKAGIELNFWQSKSGAEVDFVAKVGNEIIPVEVKLKENDLRVERSMQSFIDEYAPSRGFIVFREGKIGEIEKHGCKIKFVHLPKLLAELRYKSGKRNKK